jgi:hypothetical protein
VTLPLAVGALYALNPNLTLPYTLQWNVALQHALGSQQSFTLSYVASAGRNLTITTDLNEIPTSTGNLEGSNQDQYRPNPNFETIYYVGNAATSDYNSLQAQFQRQMSKGLQALVSYTWSHSIDDTSYDDTVGGTALNRSNSDFDVRQSMSAAVSYAFPKVRESDQAGEPFNRVLRAIANDWYTDSIVTARTGLPIDIQFGGTNLVDGEQVVLRPNLVSGQPIWVSNPTVPRGQQLNVNAFAYPASTTIYPYPTSCPTCSVTVYQQGDLARNHIALPGMYQLNAALRRQFSLGDLWKLQFKGEAFNVLNHPVFAGYNSYWFPGETNFGQAFAMMNTAFGGVSGNGGLSSLYQNGGPRSMQVSLKLVF